MAASRNHKLGSIFERVTGLLEAGVIKKSGLPIWYEVYLSHPPKYEPRYDRPAPNIKVRNIIYEEDLIRAKLHKKMTNEYFDLSDNLKMLRTKRLIQMCQEIMAAKKVSVGEALQMMNISKMYSKASKNSEISNKDV